MDNGFLQRALARGVAFAAAVVIASSAKAQVLELQNGSVTVYDRPMAFSRSGATPIASPTSPPAGPRGLGSRDLVDAASAAELSPALIEAVAWRESRGHHGSRSPRGAIGEMQLMPGTARGLKVDPLDPRQNYRGGAAYLSALMRRYDGDLERALAAYNAGPGAVDRHGGVPPYRETQAYVAAVMDRLSRRAEAAGE